jgi:hypothetical protein
MIRLINRKVHSRLVLLFRLLSVAGLLGAVLVQEPASALGLLSRVSHPLRSSPQTISAPEANGLAHLRAIMDQYTNFNIYSDKYSVANHFDPSGWMGDKGDIAFDDGATTTWHTGGNSIRITYTPAGPSGWAGIYWQHPKDNWGQVPGVGFNLSGVSRLTFWARGANGGEKAEFKVGGITGSYPDSLQSAVSTGVLTLSSNWQPYAIDLAGRDLSYVIGGFAWVTSQVQNPSGATIYLDDIRFEEYTNKLRLLESYVSLTNFVPPLPMDTHRYLYVYMDKGSTFNAYFESGWTGDYGDIRFDSGDTTNPHSGTSAICVTYSAAASQGQKWAGIYWQAPAYNWGDRTGGYNLSGAARLTFWARGASGGEKIEFLLGGITGLYNDSVQPPRKTGVMTLTPNWQSYTINLTGADLSRISGGFAWTATQADNPNGATFYLDDIRYENAANPPGDAYPPPEFPPDSYMMLTAHTYDNALGLLAFLASGEPGDADRAKLLADSLIWAQQHDEIVDGRIRNVYYADDLQTGTTYGNTGNIARHNYDKYGNGMGTGNTAWAMLALLNYYQKYGGSQYLSAALGMGNWIVNNTNSATGAGGYTGGVQGWEPTPEILTYKSTEHNIDVYVAFMKLYEATADPVWRQRAMHAKNFVAAMWNDTDGFFYTGTRDDGKTINTDVLPLDVNTWGFLALGEVDKYGRGLTYALSNHYTSESIGGVLFEGFDFNTDKDGVWWEGTGQMVTALWAQYYFSSGSTQTWSYDNATKFRDELREAQTSAPRTNGKGIVATNHDQLTTGFDLPTGGPWYYFNRLHVGATAWFVFSELQWNPFWGIPANQIIPYQGGKLYLPLILR